MVRQSGGHRRGLAIHGLMNPAEIEKRRARRQGSDGEATLGECVPHVLSSSLSEFVLSIAHGAPLTLRASTGYVDGLSASWVANFIRANGGRMPVYGGRVGSVLRRTAACGGTFMRFSHHASVMEAA